MFSEGSVILFTRGGVRLIGGVPTGGGGVSWRPPATAAVGTHPTGMHSCFNIFREPCTEYLPKLHL